MACRTVLSTYQNKGRAFLKERRGEEKAEAWRRMRECYAAVCIPVTSFHTWNLALMQARFQVWNEVVSGKNDPGLVQRQRESVEPAQEI